MITAFHGNKFCDELSTLEGVEDHVKEGFHKLVQEFMKDLFSLAELDEETLQEEFGMNSAFYQSVKEAQQEAQQSKGTA